MSALSYQEPGVSEEGFLCLGKIVREVWPRPSCARDVELVVKLETP
jgi:hypothetical protein